MYGAGHWPALQVWLNSSNFAIGCPWHEDMTVVCMLTISRHPNDRVCTPIEHVLEHAPHALGRIAVVRKFRTAWAQGMLFSGVAVTGSGADVKYTGW